MERGIDGLPCVSLSVFPHGDAGAGTEVLLEKRFRGVSACRDYFIDCTVRTFQELAGALETGVVDGNDNQTGEYPILDYARSKGVGWRDDSILVEPPPRSWYHADQAERYWRTLPVVLEHEHYEGCVKRGSWSSELLVKSVEDHHASYMSIHGDPKKLLDENREAFEKIARRLGYRFVPQTVIWPNDVKVGKNGETFEVSFSFTNGGVAPCYHDAFPCLTVKDDKGRILAVLADGGFNLKGLLPRESKSHVAKFRIGRFGAPTLPSGKFDVHLSVGKSDGTPVYELPISGDDSQRRYKVGTIVLTNK